MSEVPEERVGEILDQLEAAGGLISSLESEVADLRSTLDETNVALRAANEEVAARGGAVEEAQHTRTALEQTVSELQTQLDDTRRLHADEQIKLRNDHINELADLRRTLEEQRRSDVAAASSEERFEALKEELRREREALEERHDADLEALETSSKEWEEKLREGYREQEERHREELERVLREHEEQVAELDRTLREDFERQIQEERKSSGERHESTVAALENAAEGRESEIQANYRSVIESQQAELETQRAEIEALGRRIATERKEAAREVKKVAEERERQLKKLHSTKLSELGRDWERKLTGLQAQREADNNALIARHTEESARQRREYEERLLTEDERRKQETWALEERLTDAGIQRETELKTYHARFRELEVNRLAQETLFQEQVERLGAAMERRVTDTDDRVSSASDALERSQALTERLDVILQDVRNRIYRGEFDRSPRPAESRENGSEGFVSGEDSTGNQEQDASVQRLIDDLDAKRVLSEERANSLEARLREAEKEAERNSRELEKALLELRRLSDPERRLRDGIALFNSSEHARAVASIAKALGLPKVHASIGEGKPGDKPTLTFVWDEMAWRRYVSDPTEGVEEPRVYLSGTGDDPRELEPDCQNPNARMDSRGRLLLGVQAR